MSGKKFTAPIYRQTSPSYLIEIPFVQTSGRPGSSYEWNNAANAAVHSILAALIHCKTKSDLIGWLEIAKRQLDDAVKVAKKPHTKVMPYKKEAL